jgi:hypothetical protein
VAFTSRAATFESAARLQIAVAAGLPLASTGAAASFRDLSREQYLAGRYGSCDALALAHKLELPWTEQVCVHNAQITAVTVAQPIYLVVSLHCTPDHRRSTATSSCSCQFRNTKPLFVHTVVRSARFASTTVAHSCCYCCLRAVQHQVCHGAAASGDLAKLQWLRLQQQCPWDDERIAAHAAESGSVAMLQWLKEQAGVVFNCWACRSALPFFDVVMYLDREGDIYTQTL